MKKVNRHTHFCEVNIISVSSSSSAFPEFKLFASSDFKGNFHVSSWVFKDFFFSQVVACGIRSTSFARLLFISVGSPSCQAQCYLFSVHLVCLLSPTYSTWYNRSPKYLIQITMMPQVNLINLCIFVEQLVKH